MFKLFTYIFILFSCSILSQEQPYQSPKASAPNDFNSFKERLYIGGNVGAWFGNTTFINLSPIVGCKITKKFSLGAGVTYNYFSQTINKRKYETTIYGANFFARYLAFENVFAQVGWDRLSVPNFNSPLQNTRAWVDNLLVGGGYRQSFSEKGTFVAAIFYNINESLLSPYPNPIIQIGFNFGF